MVTAPEEEDEQEEEGEGVTRGNETLLFSVGVNGSSIGSVAVR